MMNDIERVRDALQFIDPANRDAWLRAGMAVKSELGDAGRDLWETWSQQAESFNAADSRDVWRSISADGQITVGSLFHEAKANGWCNDGRYQPPSPEELAERQRNAADRAAKEQAAIARERADTAAKAAAILKAASPALADHPYLVRKQISPVPTLREIDAAQATGILGYTPKSRGVALAGRLLAVPVKQGDAISTLELIDAGGRKAALSGRGSKAGGYWASERLPDAAPVLLVGEGVATVLSAAQATGHPAIAALSSGNLLAVAQIMRERYPTAKLILLADLVRDTGAPDPHAIDAAQAVSGFMAVPAFGVDRTPAQTDFNDMAVVFGLDEVSRAIKAANSCRNSRNSRNSSSKPANPEGWPEPQPLTAKAESEPYPLDALPDTMRGAVAEVCGFVKAPVPLVAGCALAALSLAAQAQIDVKRADRLHGPTGLFMLAIADSGERKSTCDGFFSSAIRDYEAAQAEAAKPLLKDYAANIEAWEAKRGGLKEKIRQGAKQGKATAEAESALRTLEHEKPQHLRVPKLLYGDATPEALVFDLAKSWPSGGVVSAEAGIVFGSHGMGGDSVMRNLAVLNVLWDGGQHSVTRRTSESFTVRGARLTVALQVQEATLRAFLDKSGALARGTGFLARFLVAWPESTQGHRPFSEPPEHWPALAAFNQRIEAILKQPAPIDEVGALEPALLSLAPDAKAAWVQFHDAIEAELSSGGELYDVRDVAAKAADNVARLAALFQLFEQGIGAVSLDCIERAARIVAWHLSESRRFFGELALPIELADAVRLDGWLLDYCRREHVQSVGKNHVRQHGPLRDGARLDAAIRELSTLDRLRIVKDGRRLTVLLNPPLVGGRNVN